MLHFTSLGLKENHSSCTGTKPCVCLSPSGWLVSPGPQRRRGAGRNSWALGCQPLPGSAVGPASASAGFKAPGVVMGLVTPCPNLQVSSIWCPREVVLTLQCPFPWGCSEQPVCAKLVMGPCPQASRKLGSELESSGAGGQTALFPLGTQIKGRAVCRGTGKKSMSSCSPNLGNKGSCQA